MPGRSAGTLLPIEILLRILRFAMQSPFPIVDPLSFTNMSTLSGPEITRGNQISIHFLATCKAMRSEGIRYFWSLNTFVFTSPEALYQFAELKPQYRNQVDRVTLRIIARYYDDVKRRHKLERAYHVDLKKDQNLHVQLRPKESPLVRGGFRCYTWSQVADFLTALRAPYDPRHKDKNHPRPRLFPSLKSLRLDLVNFSDSLAPFSGSELHHITSHELGCTLDELQVTGMPADEMGMRAAAELCGMLKDEGLYLDGTASFIALSRNLQPLTGTEWHPRVVRAWEDEDDDVDDYLDEHDDHMGWHRPKIGLLPPAATEKGHPASTASEDKVIWKKVPVARDSDVRSWVEFSRFIGSETSSSDDGAICPCCGDIHPGEDMFSDDELMI